jgi:hypothetical protein
MGVQAGTLRRQQHPPVLLQDMRSNRKARDEVELHRTTKLATRLRDRLAQLRTHMTRCLQFAYGTAVYFDGCRVSVALQQPLFPGDSEWQQLLHIFKLLGTPNEGVWPGVSRLRDW